MKIERIIMTTVPDELEITNATLLLPEECEILSDNLRIYKCPWWLRAPAFAGEDYADYVDEDGYVSYSYVYNHGIAIRPALQIQNLELSQFKIGDCFIFGNKEFEIILKDLAFCKSDIGTYCFKRHWGANNANVYEFSDVKERVDNWFNENADR